MSFIGELKRRNVIRVGILYLVGAWLPLQLADVRSSPQQGIASDIRRPMPQPFSTGWATRRSGRQSSPWVKHSQPQRNQRSNACASQSAQANIASR